MPYIIYCTGNEKEAFELKSPSETTFGRTSDNNIIILEDGSISRKHTLLKISEEGKAYVEDLGSSNGTFLNAECIGDASFELSNGDILKIGNAEFIFCVNDFENFADAPLPPVKLKFSSNPVTQSQPSTKKDEQKENVSIDTVRISKEHIIMHEGISKGISAGSFALTKGSEIEGYRIIRELGEGAFSKVFLAYQKSVDRTVVIKIFTIKQNYDPQIAFDSFKQYLFKITNLDHPNLLHYYDCGVSSRFVFISMPYISEGTLRDKILRKGRIPIENAIDIACTAAETMDSILKNSGGLHLSINPSNVIFTDNSAVIFADYGLKSWKFKFCVKDESAPTWFRYDSPELVSGEEPDYLSDIYSIGVLLSEMLSGTIGSDKHFNIQRVIEICKAPPRLIQIIKKLTAPSKSARVQTYEALIDMLNSLRKEEFNIPTTTQRISTKTTTISKIKQHQSARKIIFKLPSK